MSIAYSGKKAICFLLIMISIALSTSAQKSDTATFEWATCPACPVPDSDTSFLRQEHIRYGYLTVPENRQHHSGKQIRIAVQFFSALNPNSGKPPMIILHGGPGGRGIGNFPPEYDGIRKESDIILIDQRGSGLSEPDFSPEMNQQILEIFADDLTPEGEMKARTAVAANVKEALVKKGIDLSAYNSREIAADINDLCKLLGYKSWNLWGTSYGTRIALTMMRDFPQGINSVILAAPLPPNVKYFQNVTANFRRALNLLFDRCMESPAGKRSYPHLKEDFIAAIDSLEKKPLVIAMKDHSKFVINAQDILLAFHQALYDRGSYPVIPLLIEQLKNRNEPALRAFVESMSNGIFRLKYGNYYTVICSDCMPFNSLKAFEDSSAGYWQGISFYKDEFSICNMWNAGPYNSIDSTAVTSNIPVLVLSGEMDPIASSSGAVEMVKTLPGAFLYVFSNTGHFVMNDEALKLVMNFLADPAKEPGSVHYIKTADIPFITDVHVNTGITRLAPVLQLNKANIIYISWILLTGIFILLTIILSVYSLLKRRPAPSNNGITLRYALIAVNAILCAFFLVALILIIAHTARENYQILGFGLPERYAGIFILPYIILALDLLLVVLWLTDSKRYLPVSQYLGVFFLQIPFICFVIYFGFFY